MATAAVGRSGDIEYGTLLGGESAAGQPGKAQLQDTPPASEDSNSHWSYIQQGHDSGGSPPARRLILEAIAEDEERQGDIFPALGGSIHDNSGASCATAAKRMSAIGTLARRQVRQHMLEWAREMVYHISKLHAYKPSPLEDHTLHRARQERVRHRLARMSKLEAARLQKRAVELRAEERRGKARPIREELQD